MNWKPESRRRNAGLFARWSFPAGRAGNTRLTLAPRSAAVPQRMGRARLALLAAGLAAVLCTTGSIAAAEGGAAAQRLTQLRTRLNALQRSLEHTRGQRDSQINALRDSEKRIGRILLSLRRLDAERQRQNGRLVQLHAQELQERRRISGQLRELEDEARAAYILGRQEYLKLLLNQQDPATVSRVLTYYGYLQRARAGHIAAARKALASLTAITNRIRKREHALVRLRADQAAKRQALLQSEARRRTLLVRLNRKVISQSREIGRLQADEQRLGRLVKGIQNVMVGTSPVPLPGPNSRFADFRGRLPLPVAGRIVDRFGEPEGFGTLKWQGVFLAAPQGSKVVSVFNGRVAYADWLRGFGMLMIIDHGDGYMSLYAHNQSLYEQVGDWVRAGQVIATVGNTGGASQPGLYFEVLHDEKPVNPLKWCKIR
ncbi:MAG: murein hydrolase activator EnvC family protein [Acidiferrobacterales bacterium]